MSKDYIEYNRCPLCKSPFQGLRLIEQPERKSIFGCEMCRLRMTGKFFVHQCPRAQVKSCPLGHPVTPDLEPGEPANSKRVGWVKCPECARLASVWEVAPRVKVKPTPYVLSTKQIIEKVSQPRLL
jgi:hypothetical protein